jgi:hypothetical protein
LSVAVCAAAASGAASTATAARRASPFMASSSRTERGARGLNASAYHWHERFDQDPGNRWLREEPLELYAE